MTTNRGYTLIEIMIALAVFAILATITATSMLHAFDTRARVNIQSDQLNTLQIALTLISRDVTQIIPRAVIGTDMHLFAPFIGTSNAIEFTRGGIVNPDEMEPRSTLKRVALICRGTTLIRRTWTHLDAPTRKHYQDKRLLNNLKTCSFSYLNNNRQTLAEWGSNTEILPIAVQFNLSITHWGNMNLLFSIPEALYAAA